MIRTERHIILKSNVNFKKIDELCFLSKNLYNYVNYQLRQLFLNKEELPSKFDMINQLVKEDQFDYKNLPAQTSQQVILNLFNNWKSYFKLVKKKCQKHVGLPRYKDKAKGRNILVFTNQQAKLREGFIHFPKRCGLNPVKTRVDNIKQVRVVPQSTCYVVEVIHEKECVEHDLNENLYIGIDLGINNLCSITSNDPANKPFIINGRPLKSFNQFYNKTLSKLQSDLMLKTKKRTSKRIQKLTHKRNCKVSDYLHKTSRFIINYCIENSIKNIVIGYNEQWKTNVELGKVNNQKFVQIPFLKLVSQLKYKAEEAGVNVILTEESYTSKCDSLNLEELKHSECYYGKRIKRGLFRNRDGVFVNSDINGSLNILRKVIGDDCISPTNRGFVLNPVKINVVKEVGFNKNELV